MRFCKKHQLIDIIFVDGHQPTGNLPMSRRAAGPCNSSLSSSEVFADRFVRSSPNPTPNACFLLNMCAVESLLRAGRLRNQPLFIIALNAPNSHILSPERDLYQNESCVRTRLSKCRAWFAEALHVFALRPVCWLYYSAHLVQFIIAVGTVSKEGIAYMMVHGGDDGAYMMVHGGDDGAYTMVCQTAPDRLTNSSRDGH